MGLEYIILYLIQKSNHSLILPQNHRSLLLQAVFLKCQNKIIVKNLVLYANMSINSCACEVHDPRVLMTYVVMAVILWLNLLSFSSHLTLFMPYIQSFADS